MYFFACRGRIHLDTVKLQQFTNAPQRILSMNKILIMIFLWTIHNPAQSQLKNKEMVKTIELEQFSNRLALQMGQAVVELAKSREQHIGIEISRLNHTVFLYIDDSLPEDKHNWLRRKANVAKRFEESSLAVKNDLEADNMSLDKTFGLIEQDFLAKGGSIPIFVRGAGMVATITVSGLHDVEDHQIIIDALSGRFF